MLQDFLYQKTHFCLVIWIIILYDIFFFQIATVALATLALSASIPEKPSVQTASERNVETFDSASVRNLPQQMPLTIQLPREEPSLPFYSVQPSPYLSVPQVLPNPQPNFYQVPVPSEYLTAPTEGSWNPNNDPALYFELPPSITKESLPTKQFPKKFNKDVHLKIKPYSFVPKQEIVLEPINENQYIQKQKDLFKTVQELNKKENQKIVEKEKVPIYVIPVRQPSPNSKPRSKKVAAAINTTLRPIKKLPGKTVLRSNNNDDRLKNHRDSSVSDTTIEQQTIDSEKRAPKQYNKGLAPRITDSLGIASNHESDKKDRVLFHMVGQDGPMSYKWGYDTGSG